MRESELKNDSYFTTLEATGRSMWERGKPPLNNLDIELTERCNNNCIHCYINLPADDRSAMERELSTEQVKDILEKAAALGCLMVRFTGGEPLLRDDFEDLYIFARNLGLKILLFTNATLITPYMAELFARAPLLTKVEITLYGMKKESYEAVTRSPGSFEAAWRGVNLLLEKSVPFVVKGALLPPNKGEVDEFTQWSSSVLGRDVPPTLSKFFDLRCRRDSEDKNRLIKGLRASPEEVVVEFSRRGDRYREQMKQFFSKFTKPQGDKLFSCGAGIRSGCVDAYGYFQLCLLLRHPDTVYELKKGSMKNALTDFFPKVRQMNAKNADYLAHCARCFLKGLCEQCPAKSWMEHGTLDTPIEYFCEIAHAQARYMGLLEQDEMAWEVEDWRERVRNLP